ncbi:hypothetical protein D3C85_1352890 [compost metagenome]
MTLAKLTVNHLQDKANDIVPARHLLSGLFIFLQVVWHISLNAPAKRLRVLHHPVFKFHGKVLSYLVTNIGILSNCTHSLHRGRINT